MTFGAPWGWLALAAVPVILWLHRRRLRAPSLVVSSLAPWLDADVAPPLARRGIATSLLLALRLLAACLLAAALAAPRLKGASETGERGANDGGRRAVIVDASTSMAADGTWAEAIDRARQRIREAGGRHAVLLAAGPEARIHASGPTAIDALDRLAAVGTGADIPGAIRLARALHAVSEIFVVTDLVPSDAAAHPDVRWEVVGRGQDNVAIVHFGAEPSGGVVRVFAQVAAFTTATVPRTVRVLVDGQVHASRKLELTPGETRDLTWDIPGDGVRVRLELQGADGLEADDHAELVAGLPPIVVQVVGLPPDRESSDPLLRALSALPRTEVRSIGRAELRTDGSVDVTVWRSEVPDELPPGGHVLIQPPDGPWTPRPATAEGSSPGSAVITHRADHALLRGLDVLGVPVSPPAAPLDLAWARPVLWSDGSGLLQVGSRDGRPVVVLDGDLVEGPFSGRTAFPVLIDRVVQHVAAQPAPVQPVGVRVKLPARFAGLEVAARAEDGPSHQTTTGEIVFPRPGAYHIEPTGDGPPGVWIAAIAGDPIESDLRPLGAEGPAASSTSAVGWDPSRWNLPPWGWFVLLAVGLGTLEATLIGGRMPGSGTLRDAARKEGERGGGIG